MASEQNTLQDTASRYLWWFSLSMGLVAASAWKLGLQRESVETQTYPTALGDGLYAPASMVKPGDPFWLSIEDTEQQWSVMGIFPETISASQLEKIGYEKRHRFYAYEQARAKSEDPRRIYIQSGPGQFLRIEPLAQNSKAPPK